MATEYPIVFHCPCCGGHLMAREAVSGKKRHCPKCNVEIEVPGETAPNRVKDSPREREVVSWK